MSFVAAIAFVLIAQPRVDPFAGLPGVIEEVPVAGELKSMGVPVRARVVRSSEKPEVLRRQLEVSFRRAGLYIPPPKDQFQLATAPALSGYEPDTQLGYTAIFKVNADGTTTLVLGVSGLTDAPWAQPAPASLPVMPGARHTVEAGEESARTVSYSVKATGAEVDSFYRAVLGAAGWTWLDAEQVFERPAATLQLSHSLRPDGLQAVTLALRPKGRP